MMSQIANLLQKIKQELPTDCTLVAVSKTKPIEALEEAYQAGQRDFGENKVQELTQKAEQLPKDIKWHMIGHLQRNKVKYIAPFIHLIHGVDSLRLLEEINKQGEKNNRKIDCLLQMHIAEEETKFGLDHNELQHIMSAETLDSLNNIRIVGLMGMATNTENSEQIRKEFRELKKTFDAIKETDHINTSVSVLSMGMSGDYLLAVDEGSNMVRVGSAIFGSRTYSN